ncbi:hypothetical protein D1872_248860 [compost metagenome]
MILLLGTVHEKVTILREDAAKSIKHFCIHMINAIVLLIQQIIQVLVKFDQLLRTLNICVQPVFIDFRFNISILLLILGYESTLRIPHLLLGLLPGRLDISRNPMQTILQCLNVR